MRRGKIEDLVTHDQGLYSPSISSSLHTHQDLEIKQHLIIEAKHFMLEYLGKIEEEKAEGGEIGDGHT